MKTLALALLVSFTAVSAGAANWVAVYENPEKGIYDYVDIDSISKQGNYKQAFIKSVKNLEKRYVVALISYDCKSNPKRWKPTHVTLYDLEGNALESGSNTASTFRPALPDSVGETQANMICNL